MFILGNIQYQQGNTWSAVFNQDTVSTRKQGQFFTIPSDEDNYEIGRVKALFQWSDVSKGSGSMVCRVYDVGAPIGTLIATSNETVDISTIKYWGDSAPNYSELFFTFPRGIFLLADTQYVFLFEVEGEASGSNALSAFGDSAGTYSGGHLIRERSYDNGESWSWEISSSYDMYFTVEKYMPMTKFALLQENGEYLLQENGYKILLERQALMLLLLETVSVLDRRKLYLNRLLREKLHLEDNLLKNMIKRLSEVIGLSGVFSKTITIVKSLTEKISFIDTINIAGIYIKGLAEILGIVDKKRVALSKRFLEKIGLIDVLVGIKSFIRRYSEKLLIKDTYIFTVGKILKEALLFIDTVMVAISKVLRELLAFLDHIGLITSYILIFVEKIKIKDISRKTVGKVLGELLSFKDTVVKTIDRAFKEIVLLIDSFERSAIKVILLTELLSIIDKKKLSIQIRLNEILFFIDNLSAYISRELSLVELLTIKDFFEKTVSKVLSELVGLKNIVIRGAVRGFGELVGLKNVFLYDRGFIKSLTEKIALRDIVIREVGSYLREVVGLKDEIVKSLPKAFSETVNLQDRVDVLKLFVRDLFERIVFKEYFGKSIGKYFKEYLYTVDIVSAVKSSILSLTERLIYFDTLVQVFVKHLFENIAVAVRIKKIVGKTFIEKIDLFEKRVFAFYKRFTELIQVADVIEILKVILLLRGEKIGIKDRVDILKVYIRLFNEKIGLIGKFFTDRIQITKSIIVKITSLAYNVGVKKLKPSIGVKRLDKKISITSNRGAVHIKSDKIDIKNKKL